jgi:hypothetical protein
MGPLTTLLTVISELFEVLLDVLAFCADADSGSNDNTVHRLDVPFEDSQAVYTWDGKYIVD